MAISDESLDVECILMTDGRFVDFERKRKLWISSYVTEDGGVSIRLDFRNGQSRTVILRQEFIARYTAHGAQRLFGAEIAGIKNVTDAVTAIDDLISILDSGEWTNSPKGLPKRTGCD